MEQMMAIPASTDAGDRSDAVGPPEQPRPLQSHVIGHCGRGGSTPEFSAWLAAIARGPICRRWRAYPNFHRDVGKRPSWRHLLIRDDPRVRPAQCPMAGWAKVAMAAIDRAVTLTAGGHRVRRVAAHDPDQRCRSTATKNGA
jgi:hypothetical protein